MAPKNMLFPLPATVIYTHIYAHVGRRITVSSNTEMIEHKLILKPKLSRRASHEMILLFAKYGNHYHNENFVTDADVKRAFQGNSIDYQMLVEKCRDPKENVPFFENLIGSTWTVSGGAKISRVDLTTGEEEFSVQGPGILTESTYWAFGEEACKARDRSIDESSHSALQSAIVNGIASIEAYIQHRAAIWNKANPTDMLIDSKTQKVSFEDKVKLWIPKMSKGVALDRSQRNWSDFIKLQKIRDKSAIHPKVQGYGVSLSNMADEINLLRTGVAGLIIDLHLIFHEKIPRVIIRMKYFPDVEAIEVTNDSL